MGKHSNMAMRKNAQRGAITTWCPACKRKCALSAWPRECRYCGAIPKQDVTIRHLYAAWEKLLVELGDKQKAATEFDSRHRQNWWFKLNGKRESAGASDDR